MDWIALGLSLRLAAATSLTLCLVGIPLAAWVAYSRSRWRPALEAIIALPLVLPPTVLGFFLLVGFGRSGWFGQWYSRLTGGGSLAFSFGGLWVASVLYSLPFLVQPVAAAMAGIPRRLREAAWVLGAGRAETFLRVVLPLAWPGIASGIVLSFAHTMGEFGVVLMVGGDIPGVTRTISISVYDAVESLDYGLATRTALFLFVFSFLLLSAAYRLQKRVLLS
ncbi:Molybdenum transport system permease protein ModB [Methylacidimicrobium cyclopophantes]|uniref:Molybdenum transport system permease n=1 Tax=Methylacidimicrobium cyclopophantes TaxID=1041766 RepID=A0A5E6MF99_9BACT|nr:molybdate ABC transporter permease subunit [Methylacidimicrobium cyclopophantes]VVM08164.1 Molybdenum transport system permease protein ModB [Methylacidimicrobium cyclopophantes]